MFKLLKTKLSLLLLCSTLLSYSQNTGIGTVTPGSKLEIMADNCAGTKSALHVKDSCGNSLVFVSNNGRVGMGSSNPSYKVAITGTTSIADRTVAINNIPSLYLPDQATTAFLGSIAFGNGLRNLSTPTGSQGRYMTAVGIGALQATTTGSHNTAVGYGTLYSNTTGIKNVAIGHASLYSNLTGNDNVAIGTEALYANTGNYNIGIGSMTLSSNLSGSFNVGIGYNSLKLNQIGTENTAVGLNTLRNSINGNYNTAIGCQALISNVSGSSNIGIGRNAMYANQAGSDNIAIGTEALATSTSGGSNVALGYEALKITNSSFNTGIGVLTLAVATSGGSNTALGFRAGSTITSGSGNIHVGYFPTTTNITTGSNNIIIGNDVFNGVTATASNQLNVGNLIFGTGLSSGTTLSTGYVGVGASSPKSTFETGGSLGYKVVTKSANYTAAEETIILVNATSAAVTVSLPAASAVPGRIYIIKKIAGANNVIIDPNGSELLDGASTQTISTANQRMQIVCNGTAWYIID